MASRRTLRERRAVNYNEDALEAVHGSSKSAQADLHVRTKDRYISASHGEQDDPSCRSDSDFASTRPIARKQSRRKSKSDSDDTDAERPNRKKRKEKPIRELPGRSARPATYKDGSSGDENDDCEDDGEVSIGGTADNEDKVTRLSQEDIADIASAEIPAEDVAMLEDGSGEDDKAADNEPAAIARPRLRKRASPVAEPEASPSEGEASAGQSGPSANEKKAKLLMLSKLSEKTREKKTATENTRARNSRKAPAKETPEPAKRRSTRDNSRVNLAEPDSDDDEEEASGEEESEFVGSDASSGSDAENDEQASFSEEDDDFVHEAPRRPPPTKQSNGAAVRRSGRAAPTAPAPKKEKAQKAPTKKGKGKAAAGKRKAPASRSRSGSRKTTPADSEDEEASEEEGESASEVQSESDVDESDLERVEKILDVRQDKDGKEHFFVKFKEVSYRKAEWVPGEELWEVKAQLLRNFMQRRAASGGSSEDDEEASSRGFVNGINPDWLVVDRVIAQSGKGASTEYLVKWCQLSYSEATWEAAKHLSHAEDKEKVALFKKREQPAAVKKGASTARTDVVPSFLNGRKLRDYQRDSLKWMMANFRVQKNCILGDEMGLGKTAQSIATLAFQRQFLGIAGPHIVIAPLTTLGHWQREIETWTGMNVVQYTGSKADREMIRKHEFYYANADKGKKKRYKFDVLLTSYETVLKDSSVFLGIQDWGTMIADEAHRFKSVSGSTRRVVTSMRVKWKLLLTGTPVQNSMEELFGILNVLDPVKYDDEEDFLERFGKGMPTLEQVQDLQAELRPVLLRRMKEDVENLPDKEEVVVWVELTTEQRHFYKAIYGKQIGALLGGASTKNTPQLQNLAMELRKVCCHPFLCRGLEDHMLLRQAKSGAAAQEIDRIVNASGKMVLLNKLLPKLRAEGHKVLIFSQFKIMLDVLEDFLRLGGFPFERIDGSVSQRDREDAINRYSKEGSDGFVFLLSTRAGGQGITLTAADTVIIYDTDFNPQNDLQAMARCHRIGQDKEVKVYRLITSGTYEQNVFECSTRKQGLDNAILGFLNADERKVDGARIAQLLAHGAHALAAPDEEVAKEGEAFASEDIDAILARRTEKRQLGNSKGNTFSTATFSIQEEDALKGPVDPRDYWSAILPEAVADYDAQVAAAAVPVDLGKRQRRKVVYNEVELGRAKASESSETSSSGSEFEAEDAAEDEDESGSGDGSAAGEEGADGKRRRRRTKEERKEREWRHTELKALEDNLLLFGEGNPVKIRSLAGLEKRSVEEVAQVEQALVRVIKRAALLPPQPPKGANTEGAPTAAPAAPTVPLLVPELEIPKFAKKAFEGAVSRLEKHGRKHAAQLKDRDALNRLVAESDPFKEALGLAMLVPKASNLPAAWTATEDARLLLAAQRFGYYPNSATRRQNASEGFLARFLMLYTPIRLDPQHEERKLADAVGPSAAAPTAEAQPPQPAAPPAAPATGAPAAATAAALLEAAKKPEQAPAGEGMAAAGNGSAAAAAAEKATPSKPGATPKKVFRPPWSRTPPTSADKASSQPADKASSQPADKASSQPGSSQAKAEDAPKPAPAPATAEPCPAAPVQETVVDALAEMTFDPLELVDASKLQSAIQAAGKRYKALVQVVVSPDAARAEAAAVAAAEAAAAARREKRKAEKKAERAARKEAERRARKEQKYLERRAHLERLALGCFGTSDAAARIGVADAGAGNAEKPAKPPSAKKRPPSAGMRTEANVRRLSHGHLMEAGDDDFAPLPKKAHSGAKAEKENSMSGRTANVPAAVAGEGIVRKPHIPKPSQSGSAKRKALKQTTLSFSKRQNTGQGTATPAEDDPIVVSSEEDAVVID